MKDELFEQIAEQFNILAENNAGSTRLLKQELEKQQEKLRN